mmetsp:Transcript_7812/g.14539  ORF Transcript_7812/g.14539 Transcript_7812/m.14539 type:complete len:411 (-) Transcript_7812:112-1344(-)
MINQLDFFPKLQEDLKVRTLSGGAVSMVSLGAILVLFFSELARYSSVAKTEHVIVDTQRETGLSINFDITFHQLPCSLISVDAKDSFGEHQTNVNHHITKLRLDKDGKPIDDSPTKMKLKETLETEDLKALSAKDKQTATTTKTEVVNSEEKSIDKGKKAHKCLSCYGAEASPDQCCNTCDELRTAYISKGWAMEALKTTVQCQQEHVSERVGLVNHEGCRLTGYLNVTRVAGNFHLSPGRTRDIQSVHVYDLGAFSDGKFNISHSIHTLSFGEAFPGSQNPLDGINKIFDQTSKVKIGMFQYFIKVVPTKYKRLDGTVIATNQFSVTDHLKELGDLHSLKPGNLPGVFVHYDFSPMRVEISESRESVAHFLTQLCAILGGVFTVAGMVDQMVYQSTRRMRKKVSLGKFS